MWCYLTLQHSWIEGSFSPHTWNIYQFLVDNNNVDWELFYRTNCALEGENQQMNTAHLEFFRSHNNKVHFVCFYRLWIDCPSRFHLRLSVVSSLNEQFTFTSGMCTRWHFLSNPSSQLFRNCGLFTNASQRMNWYVIFVLLLSHNRSGYVFRCTGECQGDHSILQTTCCYWTSQ